MGCTTHKFKSIHTGLQFLVQRERIELNALIIMTHPSFVNLFPPCNHQLSFMKFTAQQLKFAYTDEKNSLIEQCRVNKADREYQVWKRKPLSIELCSESVFFQKLEYIHYNPVKAGLCNFPEEYYYSSALFYEKGINHFNISHYLT